MSRRIRAELSLLSAVVLLSATACSSSDSDAGQPQQPQQPPQSSKHSPAAETAPADAVEPLVERAPDLDATETVAARQGRTNGNRSIEFSKGKKGDALIVAVRCQGKGKLDVTVRPVQVSFSLDCLAGEVSTTYNQVGVTGVERGGTVSVEAPSAVSWSMTIGRGEPASAEPPASDDTE
ncbi:hypothetical protein [Streptomyces sp. NPDC050704]|uniref:hypothetical protein n=1 Tax=Streptomyces sp. NPDC050704 TaxID=3157219 RepID=UPI00343495CE